MVRGVLEGAVCVNGPAALEQQPAERHLDGGREPGMSAAQQRGGAFAKQALGGGMASLSHKQRGTVDLR